MANNSSKQNILRVTKSDQYRTVNELFEHSQAGSSYYTLLLLSSFIIAAGLLLNNSPVVIGGMLVTPLLTPILVVALGLAVGEISAIKRVSSLIIKSLLIIVASAFLMALIFGGATNTSLFEDGTRTAVLYFIVAIASGVAGGFAEPERRVFRRVSGRL